MKTVHCILLSIAIVFAPVKTQAQSGGNDETITAETFVQMANGGTGPFAISPVKVENAANGFAVKWQTVNEKEIASFELQIAEDKKNFTTVKKMEPGSSLSPANIYRVDLSMNIIHSEKTYFRVKTTFSNEKVTYTDVAIVKMKKAK